MSDLNMTVERFIDSMRGAVESFVGLHDLSNENIRDHRGIRDAWELMNLIFRVSGEKIYRKVVVAYVYHTFGEMYRCKGCNRLWFDDTEEECVCTEDGEADYPEWESFDPRGDVDAEWFVSDLWYAQKEGWKNADLLDILEAIRREDMYFPELQGDKEILDAAKEVLEAFENAAGDLEAEFNAAILVVALEHNGGPMVEYAWDLKEWEQEELREHFGLHLFDPEDLEYHFGDLALA